jgi:pilus assembly protein Flp/PilA
MLQVLNRLVREEDGQGMVEYGLILALIAIVVIAAVTGIGEKLVEIFKGISAELEVPTT